MEFDWAVVGGGLFGAYAAVVLARRGNRVALIERDSRLMQRATLVNQARLHSGLHYPRSLLTAAESLGHYEAFAAEFPEAVREDFTKVYAVSRHQSKTSAPAFSRFADRLGVEAEEVDPLRWFRPGVVSLAIKVREGSFDAESLTRTMSKRLAEEPDIDVLLGRAVTGGRTSHDAVTLELSDGTRLSAGGVVLAAYAGLNPLRRSLGLAPIRLKHELAEVLLCRVAEPYRDLGITVMDGPFWSFMPFGFSDYVSMTSVGLTPVSTSRNEPRFDCQDHPGTDCTAANLRLCDSCCARPGSLWQHQFQQVARMLREPSAFTYTRSHWTVKTLLATAEVDDARPTFVLREETAPIWTVFSGKVSTVLDLEREFR